MPKFKLIYFNIKGRAELLRLMFAAADVKFEDVRVNFAEWPALKSKMPFEQLPVLEVDGRPLAQTKAIATYLAREFGLAGVGSWEQAQCHMIIDAVSDIFDGIFPIVVDKSMSQDTKGRKLVEMRDAKVKQLAKGLERYAMEHVGTTGFIVGNKLTCADLALASMYDVLGDVQPLDMEHWIAQFPALQAHNQHVWMQSRLAAYRTARAAPTA